MENTTIKTWNWNKRSELVIGNVEASSFDEARRRAADWNKDAAEEARVVFITDAPAIMGGRITTVAEV